MHGVKERHTMAVIRRRVLGAWEFIALSARVARSAHEEEERHTITLIRRKAEMARSAHEEEERHTITLIRLRAPGS